MEETHKKMHVRVHPLASISALLCVRVCEVRRGRAGDRLQHEKVVGGAGKGMRTREGREGKGRGSIQRW